MFLLYGSGKQRIMMDTLSAPLKDARNNKNAVGALLALKRVACFGVMEKEENKSGEDREIGGIRNLAVRLCESVVGSYPVRSCPYRAKKKY